MGEYYENAFHLSTERILVLEALVENRGQQVTTLRLMNENLQEGILISDMKFKALEKKYEGEVEYLSNKKWKVVIVVGIASFILGGFLVASVAL